MRKIEVKVLNPWAVSEGERMTVCAARLTQRGEKITSVDEFINLYQDDYSDKTVSNLCKLPHPTIQKFSLINVVVVGASRRFLAQITRHQNEVKFMSASLQYSDYSSAADYTVPYELIGDEFATNKYIASCQASMDAYEAMVKSGIDRDTAGYAAPQGLRNVLIISATPYQWKHMISQRICRRNTSETRYVMLRIWEQLYKYGPVIFAPELTGPFCMRDGSCKEGKMCCGRVIDSHCTPDRLIATDFPKLFKGENDEN